MSLVNTVRGYVDGRKVIRKSTAFLINLKTYYIFYDCMTKHDYTTCVHSICPRESSLGEQDVPPFPVGSIVKLDGKTCK